MKQPELGRKISELRKANGWTQEELVERCNMNKISEDRDILDSFREPRRRQTCYNRIVVP
jgi:transcriptional regulator with XRE-family HTH domain